VVILYSHRREGGRRVRLGWGGGMYCGEVYKRERERERERGREGGREGEGGAC